MSPTGMAIRDVRETLFEAAERVLLRDGPDALTSRAVTTEAGVAKGVLHKHFADMDAFLTELILDRVDRINAQARTLRAAAGTGTVAHNLAAALTVLFGSVAMAIIGLITFRDELRRRLRAAGLQGVPVAAEGMRMVSQYLAAERDLGRIAAGADVETLALMLVGGGHLLFAGQDGRPPPPDEIERVIAATLTSAGAQPH